MVLVFSAIFMGIWNSDQKAMDSTIVRNKRLNKPNSGFPLTSVEAVRRENTSPVELSVPEPKPLRIAMRASDGTVRNEPVFERHDEGIDQDIVAEDSVATLSTVPEEMSAFDVESNAAEKSSVAEVVEAASVKPLVNEPVVNEPVTTESEEVSSTESTESSVDEAKAEESTASTELSGSNESVQVESNESVQVEIEQERVEEPGPGQAGGIENKSDEGVVAMPAIESPAAEFAVSETPVAEIESAAFPSPEDFAVESTLNSRVAESAIETSLNNDAATGETVGEVVESEAVVTAEVAVMVAENSTDETAVDHSGDVEVQSEQPVAETTEPELPEPADPITADSVTSESIEEEPLEEKLLQSSEYDMLDVHAEDVTPGNVEPSIGGGATCIPLPRNLASGTWQVIHSSGEFFKITVDRGSNASEKYGDDDEAVLETSFCISTTPDGVRWCFIRSFVDSPVPVRRVTTEFFSPGQQ